MSQQILSPVIHKRTFEGINDNVITSKYMPSYKYAVSYNQYGIKQQPKAFKTKKDAQNWIINNNSTIALTEKPYDNYEGAEKCPKCSSLDVLKCHHEATFAIPECDYKQCAECGHQWDIQ